MHYQSAQAALASAKASGPQISAQEQAAVVPSVRAEVSYVQPNGSKPAILVGDGGEREEGGTRFVAREVEIANGRLTPEPHRLDRNGFEFVRSPGDALHRLRRPRGHRAALLSGDGGAAEAGDRRLPGAYLRS